MGFCATPDSDIFILGNCHSAFCIHMDKVCSLICLRTSSSTPCIMVLTTSWSWGGKSFLPRASLVQQDGGELSPKLQLDLVRTKGEMYSPWCGHVGFRAGYERSFDMSEWATWVWDHAVYLNLFIGIENQSRLEVKDADWKQTENSCRESVELCLLMKRISAHALAPFYTGGRHLQESEHWAPNRSWEMERSNCHRLRNSRMVLSYETSRLCIPLSSSEKNFILRRNWLVLAQISRVVQSSVWISPWCHQVPNGDLVLVDNEVGGHAGSTCMSVSLCSWGRMRVMSTKLRKLALRLLLAMYWYMCSVH